MYIPQKNYRITLSFYKYFEIKDTENFKNLLLNIFKYFKVFGRVYIAKEGINAQISILESYLCNMKKRIFLLHPKLENILMNKSLDNSKKSFLTLKIKIRNKIVSDGITDSSFNMYNVGKCLKPIEANEMMLSSDTLIVDIRNSYEYAIGHFKNSINIPENTFREQIKKMVSNLIRFRNKNILMYCTGGIRCEKATAWLKHNGFNKVFYIKGGIINYVRDSKKNKFPMLFKGKNFVFDLRMYEYVTNDIIGICYHCKLPYDIYINCKNSSCNLLFIQCFECSNIYNNYCSLKCLLTI